jgi:hypothetical protein
MMEAAILNGFGIKRLRILNTCSNFTANLIIFLIVSARCLKQCLFCDNPLADFELVTQSLLVTSRHFNHPVVTGDEGAC